MDILCIAAFCVFEFNNALVPEQAQLCLQIQTLFSTSCAQTLLSKAVHSLLGHMSTRRSREAPGNITSAAFKHTTVETVIGLLPEGFLLRWAYVFGGFIHEMLHESSPLGYVLRHIMSAHRLAASGSSFFWAMECVKSWREHPVHDEMLCVWDMVRAKCDCSSWTCYNFQRAIMQITMFSVRGDAGQGYYTATLRLAFAEFSNCYFGSIISSQIVSAGWLTLKQLCDHSLFFLRNNIASHRLIGTLFDHGSLRTPARLRVHGKEGINYDITFTTRNELIEGIASLRQHDDSSYEEVLLTSRRRALAWVNSVEKGDGHYALLMGARTWTIVVNP